MKYFLMEATGDGTTGGGTGSGGGTGGGTGDGNGAAGSAGAGGGTTAAGAAGGASGDSQQAGGQPAAAEWHGIKDAETVAYIKNKGWENPADAIKSYQGVEKYIGRDPSTLVTLPRADDPTGIRAVLTKLGLPESADKYQLEVPKDADPGFMGWAKETFHKVGLTAQQAKELSAQHTEFVQKANAQATKDYELVVAADKQALLQEWRGGHERMMNAAKSAANGLGFTGDMIDAMEKSIGYAATMKHFAALGTKMGEDGFVSGSNNGGRFSGEQTPAEAKAEWDKMKSDPNEGKALFDKSHPGHAAAKEKQTKLFKIMYPE